MTPRTLLVPVAAAHRPPHRRPAARADPLFGYGEDALEDAFVDGDIDEEDHVAMHLGGHTGTTDLRGQSWVSLVGFTRQLMSGQKRRGRLRRRRASRSTASRPGPVHRLADPTRPPRSVPVPAALPAPAPPPPPPRRPRARAAGSVARRPTSSRRPSPATASTPPSRTSGLGVDDARIDALIARARASAWLPETRMRAMRLWQDADHTTTVATTDTANFYDAIGANLVLELRLTWRLDRLLYAGDEATLERVRLERLDARVRAWPRARSRCSSRGSGPRSRRARPRPGRREERDARLRAAEAAGDARRADRRLVRATRGDPP